MSSRFNASKQNIEIETLPALKGECHLLECFIDYYPRANEQKKNYKIYEKSKHLFNETVEK